MRLAWAAIFMLAEQTRGFHIPHAAVANRRHTRPGMIATAGAAEDVDDVKTPMRVQLIVEPTPFTHVSGYANRFKEYLKYQQKAGAEVSIITPDDTEDPPSEFMGFPITTIRGFRFILYPVISMAWGLAPKEGYRQGIMRRMNPFRKKMELRKNKQEYLSQVSEVVADFEPEMIHVTSPGFIPIMATYIAREWKDIPLLLSYHTHIPIYSRTYAPWMGGFGEWLSWTVIRKTHEWADLTVVTSPQLKQEMEDHGVQRVEVWNKGIDTDIFHPKYGAKDWWTGSKAGADAAKAAGDDPAALKAEALKTKEMLTDGHPEAPLLIYVGRLGLEKRLRDLKDVLARVPDARLAIIGKGPDMEDLEAHFAGTPTVFTGLVTGEDLSRCFAAADVFLMPSDSETLGFVVLESMASGVPVVGCNAGGIPSIIDHEQTGFLFEAGDTAQASEQVARLLGDRTLLHTMSADARKEAERWGWEAATTKLREEQYLQAARNHRERQRDRQTLKQKLTRYRKSMIKGVLSDFFAFLGDRKAEEITEALEAEEEQLYDEIETLEKKPTTRQPFGWLSSQLLPIVQLRLVTICLIPWRGISALLRKTSQVARMPLDMIRDKILDDGEPPPALESS